MRSMDRFTLRLHRRRAPFGFVVAMWLLGPAACGSQGQSGIDADAFQEEDHTTSADESSPPDGRDAAHDLLPGDWHADLADGRNDQGDDGQYVPDTPGDLDVVDPLDLGVDVPVGPDGILDVVVDVPKPDVPADLASDLDVPGDGAGDLWPAADVLADGWQDAGSMNDLVTDSGTDAEDGAGDVAPDAADAHVPADLEDVDTEDLSDTADDTADQAGEIDVVLPDPPQILSFEVFGASGVGLSAGVNVTTDIPSTVVVYLRNLATGQEAPVAKTTQLATEHATAILMMRPSTPYAVRAEVINSTGQSSSMEKPWTTQPLPAGFPQLTTLVSVPESMSPGLTMVSAINMYTGKTFVFMVDSAGEVVFYNDGLGGWFAYGGNGELAAGRLPLGTLCLGTILGTTSLCRKGTDYGVNYLHHSHTLTPEGNVAALGLELRQLADCPQYQNMNLVGDVLIEYDPDGNLLRSIPMMAALGPDIICNGDNVTDDRSWDWVFPMKVPTYDRTHCNSVQIDPEDGNYLVSCMLVRTVAKLDRTTGELLWAIGEGGNAKLAPGGRWPRAHHSAVPGTDNRVLLYDNEPLTPPYVARAVEYQLVFESGSGSGMEAEQIWEYQSQPAIPSELADSLGEVHYLDNGNIMIIDGKIDEFVQTGPGQQYNPSNNVRSRVTEVTYPVSTEVFQLEIAAPTDFQYGFWTLSAQRVNDLGAPPP